MPAKSLAFLLGCLIVAIGIGLIFIPAGVIAAGIGVLAVSILMQEDGDSQ